MTRSDDSAQHDAGSMPQLRGVAKDGLELIRQELSLARQETIEKLTPAARSTGMLVGGGVMAAFGGAYLVQAVVRALATRMPLWLASLVAGTGLTVGGILLMRRGGSQLKHISVLPEKTIHSLREDKAWLLHQITSRLR
jgi:hypothetical protein